MNNVKLNLQKIISASMVHKLEQEFDIGSIGYLRNKLKIKICLISMMKKESLSSSVGDRNLFYFYGKKKRD